MQRYNCSTTATTCIYTNAYSHHKDDGTVRLSYMSYAIKLNTAQRYGQNLTLAIRGSMIAYVDSYRPPTSRLYKQGTNLCIDFAIGIAIATNTSGESKYQIMIFISLVPKMVIGIFLIIFNAGVWLK